MPYIAPELLESSIFLYPSKSDADHGAHWGGSGFLVGFGNGPDWVYIYAVTNDHVALQCPVIRLTVGGTRLIVGTPKVIDGTSSDWISHPGGDDVAIRPLGLWPWREMRHINQALLLREPLSFGRSPIGAGDECLMIGRYINRDLQQLDRPVVRFGNLALSPPEPFYQDDRTFNQDSFLVDLRSQAGFSGSPVLIYYEEQGWRGSRPHPELGISAGNASAEIGKTWLLGINWGHIPIWTDIRQDQQVIGKVAVSGGLAGVVPAWKLADLLYTEERDMERKKAWEEVRQRAQSEGAAALD